MSQYRMGGPHYRPQRSKHPTRNKIIGVTLMVLGVPMMFLLPLAFLGLPIDGVGYLTGHGEQVTVTVVESSHAKATSRDEPGKGYFTHDGHRTTVRLDDVNKGEKLPARIAITSDPGDADPKAYAGSWAAIKDLVWGLIFMLGCVCIGLGLYRAGRGVARDR